MAEQAGSQPPPPPIGRSEPGGTGDNGEVSHRRAYVRPMDGGIGADYLRALAAMVEAGVDPSTVCQAVSVLADCAALAERAQHGDQGVALVAAERLVGQDGGLGVVEIGAHRDPTEAA